MSYVILNSMRNESGVHALQDDVPLDYAASGAEDFQGIKCLLFRGEPMAFDTFAEAQKYKMSLGCRMCAKALIVEAKAWAANRMKSELSTL